MAVKNRYGNGAREEIEKGIIEWEGTVVATGKNGFSLQPYIEEKECVDCGRPLPATRNDVLCKDCRRRENQNEKKTRERERYEIEMMIKSSFSPLSCNGKIQDFAQQLEGTLGLINKKSPEEKPDYILEILIKIGDFLQAETLCNDDLCDTCGFIRRVEQSLSEMIFGKEEKSNGRRRETNKRG